MIAATAFFFYSSAAFSQTVTKHIVQRGETLTSIAHKYAISEETLLESNPLAKNYLYTGMTLNIPAIEKSESVTKEDMTSPTLERTQTEEKTFVSDSFIERTRDANNRYRSADKYFGFGYQAGSFSDIKKSGMYGMFAEGYDSFGHNIGFSFFTGLNFGLVDGDDTSSIGGLGPNVSYHISDNCLAVLPVFITANYYGKVSWGWSINPKLAFLLGEKIEAQFGLLINGGFKGGDAFCGFSFSVGRFDL